MERETIINNSGNRRSSDAEEDEERSKRQKLEAAADVDNNTRNALSGCSAAVPSETKKAPPSETEMKRETSGDEGGGRSSSYDDASEGSGDGGGISTMRMAMGRNGLTGFDVHGARADDITDADESGSDDEDDEEKWHWEIFWESKKKYDALPIETKLEMKRKLEELKDRPRKCLECNKFKTKDQFSPKNWDWGLYGDPETLNVDPRGGYHPVYGEVTPLGLIDYLEGDDPTVGDCNHCYENLVRLDTLGEMEQKVRTSYEHYQKQGIGFYEYKPNLLFGAPVSGRRSVRGDTDDDYFVSPTSISDLVGEYDIIYEHGYHVDTREFVLRSISHGKSTLTLSVGPSLPQARNHPYYERNDDEDGENNINSIRSTQEEGKEDNMVLQGVVIRHPVEEDSFQHEMGFPVAGCQLNGLSFKFQQVVGELSEEFRGGVAKRLDVQMHDLPEGAETADPFETMPVFGEMRIVEKPQIPLRWIPRESHRALDGDAAEKLYGSIKNGDLTVAIPPTVEDPKEALEYTKTMSAQRERGVMMVKEKTDEMKESKAEKEDHSDNDESKISAKAITKEENEAPIVKQPAAATKPNWITSHLCVSEHIASHIRSFYAIPWQPEQPYFYLKKGDLVLKVIWSLGTVVMGMRGIQSNIVARRRTSTKQKGGIDSGQVDKN